MKTVFEESTLLAVLGGLSSGVYAEAAPAGVQPSRLASTFTRAGWHGVRLTVADSGASIDTLLAGAGLEQPHWLAVRGDTGLGMLEHWQGAGLRPMAILVEVSPFAQPAVPAPAWREALTRNGYLFAVTDYGFHHFVRSDQIALHERIAEYADSAWRRRLRESRDALALVQREADHAHSALLAEQTRGMAANARATMLQQQVDAIYASTSWKSTKLLRWAGRLRHEPRVAMRQLYAVARRQLVAVLRRPLAGLARRADAHPRLRQRIVGLAERHPALARRLNDMLRPAMPVSMSNVIAPAMPPAIDPNNMIGPQFNTLLLDELVRGLPPVPGQG